MIQGTAEEALKFTRQDEVYCVIKPELIEALWRYIYHGIEPGGFLTAVLENDLREAIGRADHLNVSAIKPIVTYCHMELPSTAWGSAERVVNWMKIRREAENDPRS